MENKELFVKVSDGYDCDQVNQYIVMLKAEYKKVFDYAKTVEANNEKLKKICRSLSDENKALKSSGAAPMAAAESNEALAASLAKIEKLAAEITAESKAINSLNG